MAPENHLVYYDLIINIKCMLGINFYNNVNITIYFASK